MSLPDARNRSAFDASPAPNEKLESCQSVLMRGNDGARLDQPPPVGAPLAANEDARELVRLIQCPQCSRPLRTPVTLPCGHSICRQCTPEPHAREHISYPDEPSRRQAFTCPLPACGAEHPTADCNVDVTLTKVMDAVAEEIVKHTSLLANVTTTIDESPGWDSESTTLPAKVRSHQMPGGRLIATYTLAAQGSLHWKTDISFSAETDNSRASDQAVLDDLLVSVQREVDCQVCYGIMLDPITTFCGHTLCRNCLVRVLDHSLHCPICRRGVSTPPSLIRQPSNKTLVNLLGRLCPDQIAARAEGVASEDHGNDGHTNVPLFVCALGFPNHPTFLRIFEPRYRLMLRRCLEGNRQFGMLMYNRYSEPQGELGSVHFYRYGTMLQIVQAQMSIDGTSLIETRGMYRFRVLMHGMLDGYSVGNIERIDDVSLAEEERLEAEETSRPPAREAEDDMEEQLRRMSTQGLLELGRAFTERMQSGSAVWLRQGMRDVHGEVPSNPAEFPYWFASVVPINEEEKYKLLSTRTVRERLKITARWIRRIETHRWYQSDNCRIL